MTHKFYTINIALLFFIFVFSSPVLATEYYVDQSNPAADDQNTGTIIHPWKSITKANATVTPGDTVYIKAGTYTSGTSNYIAPANSGTAQDRITYRSFDTDTVTVQNGNYGILLDGDSYITVQGIGFYNLDQLMMIRNDSDYNIIAHCTFDQQRNLSEWFSSRIYAYSDHNWIHHSTFSRGGECDVGGEDNGMALELGEDDGGASTESTYNLLENNILFSGGHHVLGIHGRFNVIRNNYLHNETWSRGAGNRTTYMVGNIGHTGRNLLESNRMGYTNAPCDGPSVSGAAMASGDNIFRYNMIYDNEANGFGLASYANGDVTGNTIYNNTFFNNCDSAENPTLCNGSSPEDAAIMLDDWVAGVSVYDNIFKNNLYHKNYTLYTDNNDAHIASQIYANEYNSAVSGDPLFVNAPTTRPADLTDATLPNLTLSSGSPAIDAGGALTTVTSGCSASTSQIVLDNASYFQDGTWGLPTEVNADWIAVGKVDNTVGIFSITGNTVKLASSISCTNGDKVWLYKDSDGTIVLSGLAPDAGANEYRKDILRPSPPGNLKILNTTSQ